MIEFLFYFYKNIINAPTEVRTSNHRSYNLLSHYATIVGAMGGVEFRQSTQNTFKIREVGLERLNSRFPSAYPSVYEIQCEADLLFKLFNYLKIGSF